MVKTISLVGIDEVGRGCLAGPVVAAAVMLEQPIEGLKDSKLLSKPTRERLSALIKEQALSFGIGFCDVELINELGLTSAISLAMQAALDQIKLPYDKIIIDGNYNFLKDNPAVNTIIKADQTIPSVSAASIIAKVARDHWMSEAAKRYPKYGFEKHVGYGTSLHFASLKKYGICPLHRTNYSPIKLLLVAT